MPVVGKKRKHSGKASQATKKRRIEEPKIQVSDVQEPQTTRKPRKLRVESKISKFEKQNNAEGLKKSIPIRKTGHLRRGNTTLKKTYFPPQDEEEKPHVPLRTTPKPKQTRAQVKKVYFPSNQVRAPSSDDESSSDEDVPEHSVVEGLVGEESLIVDSDSETSSVLDGGVYQEDQESSDEELKQQAEVSSSAEDEEDEEDSDENDQEIEDDEEDEEEINPEKRHEARLFSNVGAAADDIGFVDIDQDDDDVVDIDDGDEDLDEETGAIVQQGFGKPDPEGWADLVKASSDVQLIHSQKQRHGDNVKTKSSAKNQGPKLTGRFYGLIRVENFPHGFFEDGMRAFFSQFGNIGRCVVARSPKTHQPQGYALIEFRTEEIARIAAEAMDGYMMFHKMLKVTVEEHPGPELWKQAALKVKPISRYDVPAMLYARASAKTQQRFRRSAKMTLSERVGVLKTSIKGNEKNLATVYGVQYHYEMDPVVPDCSGSRVTLERV